MPVASDFNYPRRYNSLRLLGFDYTSSTALYFITVLTDSSRPVFGDIKLAKAVLIALLDGRTLARLRLIAYTLLPDHFHLVAGVKKPGESLSNSLGAFKSFTTQLYWKRAREIVESQSVALPSTSVQKSSGDEARLLLRSLIEWQTALRPEAVEIRNWPNVRPDHFVSKRLWGRSFHEHIIRNDADLRETVEYIAMNPVRRGYVSKPQFYPFTGIIDA
ncbi:MAG TPA: hypothetical protein VNO70_14740 [Blastocatellia bacterium]|nr:hypothetical protein [Blastocatellia bacterium]